MRDASCEWYGLQHKDEVPRIAEGKYLKLLYALHEARGTLHVEDVSQLCPECDLASKCRRKADLTVYCLEGTLQQTRPWAEPTVF